MPCRYVPYCISRSLWIPQTVSNFFLLSIFHFTCISAERKITGKKCPRTQYYTLKGRPGNVRLANRVCTLY